MDAGWSTPKNYGRIITYAFWDAANQKRIGEEYGVDQYGQKAFKMLVTRDDDCKPKILMFSPV